jgi:hypothetical protein
MTPHDLRLFCPRWLIVALAVLVGSVFLPHAATAADGCKPGFVARRSRPGDVVCVTPASRARVAGENARAPLLWVPGAFGPKTCAFGFVWREAFVGDLVCVTPAVRAAVRQENDTAADRRL